MISNEHECGHEKPNTIKINLDLIPDHVRDDIAACVLERVTEYFKQPGAQEEFERWRQERKNKNA